MPSTYLYATPSNQPQDNDWNISEIIDLKPISKQCFKDP